MCIREENQPSPGTTLVLTEYQKHLPKKILLVSLPPFELQDINHPVLLLALTVSAQSTV